MNLRDNILIQKNAIAAAELKLLNNYLRQAQMTDSLVSNFEEDAPEDRVEWIIDKKIRDTQEVKLTDAIADTLNRVVDRNVQETINSFYDAEVRDWEPPHILHYGAGGHYIPHVDAETLFKDDIGVEVWEKTLDRDLSIVYFWNNDFIGGELSFPHLELVVKPEAGTLVCFPSDHNYIHGVNPVTSGHRFAIVTWLRVKNTPTMDEINTMTMEEYHRVWPKQIEQPPRIAKR